LFSDTGAFFLVNKYVTTPAAKAAIKNFFHLRNFILAIKNIMPEGCLLVLKILGIINKM